MPQMSGAASSLRIESIDFMNGQGSRLGMGRGRGGGRQKDKSQGRS